MTVPNLVVIDGPRGVGKSTTALTVVNNVLELGRKAMYIKKMREEGNEINNMMKWLDKVDNDRQTLYVFDRFVVSEWVHSILADRVSPHTLMLGCRAIQKRILEMGGLHYVFTAPTQTLFNRLESRGTRKIDQPWPTVEPMWRAGISAFDGVMERQMLIPMDYERFVRDVVDLVTTTPNIKVLPKVNGKVEVVNL